MHISQQAYTDSCGFDRYSIARLFVKVGKQQPNNLPIL
jgi:hypothetical protein